MPHVFIQSGLERLLDARRITHLINSTVSTNSSVEASARTGNLGFAAIMVLDAMFTLDKVDSGGTQGSAEDAHLMALTNMHSEYVEVMPCEEVLRRY